MNNGKQEFKIPTYDYTFVTDNAPDKFFPEAKEPTYDVSFTITEKRIWWKPRTWFWRKTRVVALENCTIDINGKVVTVQSQPAQQWTFHPEHIRGQEENKR